VKIVTGWEKRVLKSGGWGWGEKKVEGREDLNAQGGIVQGKRRV